MTTQEMIDASEQLREMGDDAMADKFLVAAQQRILSEVHTAQMSRTVRQMEYQSEIIRLVFYLLLLALVAAAAYYFNW